MAAPTGYGYKVNQALTGLWPVRNSIGGNTPHIGYYYMDGTYATAIGEGCVVVKTATDSPALGSATAPTLGTILGVAVCGWAASTAGWLPVYDDPNQEFSIIADEAFTAATSVDRIGNFFSLTANAATALGSSLISNGKLDYSTVATTAAAGVFLQLVRVAPGVGDTYLSANCPVIVKFATYSHIGFGNVAGAVDHV